MTLADVLVGGAKVGKGAEMLADLRSSGIALAPRDDEEALRLAELTVTTGLTLRTAAFSTQRRRTPLNWRRSTAPWLPLRAGSASH